MPSLTPSSLFEALTPYIPTIFAIAIILLIVLLDWNLLSSPFRKQRRTPEPLPPSPSGPRRESRPVYTTGAPFTLPYRPRLDALPEEGGSTRPPRRVQDPPLSGSDTEVESSRRGQKKKGNVRKGGERERYTYNMHTFSMIVALLSLFIVGGSAGFALALWKIEWLRKAFDADRTHASREPHPNIQILGTAGMPAGDERPHLSDRFVGPDGVYANENPLLKEKSRTVDIHREYRVDQYQRHRGIREEDDYSDGDSRDQRGPGRKSHRRAGREETDSIDRDYRGNTSLPPNPGTRRVYDSRHKKSVRKNQFEKGVGEVGYWSADGELTYLVTLKRRCQEKSVQNEGAPMVRSRKGKEPMRKGSTSERCD
ncbi:MAG: hypothetical protein Q9219_003746 [cf. Caloplaca sp. 3 TL-2023]